jgi:UMF1 family MFS transporter
VTDLRPRRELWAWALYDFANSSFTTLVVTFIYSAWFAASMGATKAEGAAMWSWGITASALVVALLAPVIGSAADRTAKRKRWLTALTIAAIGGTAALAFVPAPHALTALALFVATNVVYELACALYNAFLPGLASPGREGRLSAYGWALGYAGGNLCLLAAIALVGSGLLGSDGGWHYRATNLLVAGWFLVFSLPALALLREPAPPDPSAGASLSRLAATLRRALRYRDAMRLLVARLIYNDGLVSIFAFGGIYAEAVFGFDLEELLWFGFWLNVFAGLGALVFGRVDDLLGGQRTVLITLLGLAAATIMAAAATERWHLWVAGALIGTMVGPNQSASRSLMARFVPAAEAAEFFGLFALSGKLTSFAGPLLLGQLIWVTGNHRIGVASLLVFFVVGGLLLLRVNEQDGVRFAAAERDRLTGRRAR